jgi:excisionase family DNA binding protein
LAEEQNMQMSSAVTDRPLLTVAQLAERLAVCEKTVRRLIEKGDLPVLRVGAQIRIDTVQLEQWLYAGDVTRLEQEIWRHTNGATTRRLNGCGRHTAASAPSSRTINTRSAPSKRPG